MRIFLTYVAPHGIDVMVGDIRNTYIQAPTSDKHFIVCDADLHGIEHAGKRAIIVRALYVGKWQADIFGYIYMHAWMS